MTGQGAHRRVTGAATKWRPLRVAIVATAAAVGVLGAVLTGSASARLPNFGGGPMTAIFQQPSYAPGQTALLTLDADTTRITVEPISALPWPGQPHPWVPFVSVADDARVADARTVAWTPGTGTVAVPIGDWPSGVYFVRIRSSQGTVAAPVIVRPKHLGAAPVLVVMPTYSWEAYNGRGGDTWYDCACVHTVDLSRPYLYGGVPYNFGQYDRGFITWLNENNAHVDVISDQDYDAIATGTELRRRYRMIIFDGHSEYATSHMFAITAQYRDLGGHLAFLSANDFFRKVAVSGNSMTLVGPFRNLGSPEASLIGAEYLDWSRNLYPNRPYVVTGERQLPWLFAHTGLRDGDLLPGWFGIEIDSIAPASPPQTVVVADIPDIFPNETAQMTYYATRSGAEVFDAGTINFGGAADQADVAQMLSNLWLHMTGTAVTAGAACPPTA